MDNQQSLLKLINQIFELEKKVNSKLDSEIFSRNFNRINDTFTEMSLIVHNPTGELFNETRTDCEASISGNKIDNLKIIEVIKPIVYANLKDNQKHLLQRGVVIVESSKK